MTLGGCAGEDVFLKGKHLMDEGNVEEGLTQLKAAVKEDPDNIEYKTYYYRQLQFSVLKLLHTADALRFDGKYEDADAAYHRVLNIDPSNQKALDGLELIKRDRRLDALYLKAQDQFKKGDFDGAQAALRPVLEENPDNVKALDLQRKIEEKQMEARKSSSALKKAFKKPITLEFRDANLKSVFEVISRTTGINFIFDKDVRPDLKATIFVKNTTIEDVINLLLVTNQLDKSVLNDNTILIYPNTPAKQKDYQELVVKSFYLANADVKQTLNMIKTMLKTRDVFIDDHLNLLVMRDTPEAIKLAEKLINLQDRAEPEVVLDVEVMEVKRSRLTELGIQWPNQFTALNIATTNTVTTSGGTVVATTPTTTTNQFTVDNLRNLTGANIAIPNPVLNLRNDVSDANILANPRIRVKNREKAKIHIGDRVPVITTTTTANVGVTESVNYLDVGLKLDVEPVISLDGDVSMKVGLEVSSIVKEIKSNTGSLTYQVGTRTANTTLRLKDGETQALAGLISDEDRANANKVPGLADIPVLGRLFSNNQNEKTKTEIVLLITPHIVRNIIRPDVAASEFSSGTESSIGGEPIRLQPTEYLREPAPIPSRPIPPRIPTMPPGSPLSLTPPRGQVSNQSGIPPGENQTK